LAPSKDSLWNGGKFNFKIEIPNDYPFNPPKIICRTKIFHPNIDENGNICLNILRADWKPMFTVTTIAFGLNELFESPNPKDPLNRDAGIMMENDPN